jgi:hypothetical protein
LSSRSWHSELRGPRLAAAQKWSGPALAGLGLAGMATIGLLATRSPFAGWLLLHTLAPERMLPLIGLGIAGGLVGTRAFAASLALFCLGIVAGFAAENWLLATIYDLAGGPTHLFMTEPISCIAIGLALIPGARLLPRLLPIAAFVVGVMLALAVFLADPCVQDPVFIWTPLLAALWVVAALTLTLNAFRRRWFMIVGRIFGSWLVTIGLLFGGTSLELNFKPPPPPKNTMQESTRGAELLQGKQIPPAPQPTAPSPGATHGPPPWTTIQPK